MIGWESLRRNTLACLLYAPKRRGIPSTTTEVITHDLAALAVARQDDLGVRAARRIVRDSLAKVGDTGLDGVTVVVEHSRVLNVRPRAVPVLAYSLCGGQLPARIGVVGSADQEDVDRGTGQWCAERGKSAWYHRREQQVSRAAHRAKS